MPEDAIMTQGQGASKLGQDRTLINTSSTNYMIEPDEHEEYQITATTRSSAEVVSGGSLVDPKLIKLYEPSVPDNKSHMSESVAKKSFASCEGANRNAFVPA